MFETNSLFILFLILCGIGVIVSALTPGRRNPTLLAWIAQNESGGGTIQASPERGRKGA